MSKLPMERVQWVWLRCCKQLKRDTLNVMQMACGSGLPSEPATCFSRCTTLRTGNTVP
jgi:hypothetical protein